MKVDSPLIRMLDAHIAAKERGAEMVPDLLSLGDPACPVVLTPSVNMPLYSLYEGDMPMLAKGYILDLILIRDNAKVTFRQLGNHFNVDPKEVEWFFHGGEDSTANQWAGGLTVKDSQDASDYETLASEVVDRWGVCQSLDISYVFWTYLLAQVMDNLTDGGLDMLNDILDTPVSMEAAQETLTIWDRNRRTARRWIARREEDLEVTDGYKS